MKKVGLNIGGDDVHILGIDSLTWCGIEDHGDMIVLDGESVVMAVRKSNCRKCRNRFFHRKVPELIRAIENFIENQED